MTTIKKTKVINLERVRQSELGMFLKLINEETPIEEIDSLVTLAKKVSLNFNVICTPADLEKFFNLENELLDEDYETESRKQKFYNNELYE